MSLVQFGKCIMGEKKLLKYSLKKTIRGLSKFWNKKRPQKTVYCICNQRKKNIGKIDVTQC